MTDIHVPAAAVEPVAKAIYDALPYDGPGEKPAWVPRGNSLKQEECRAKAIAALTAALAAWVECGMANLKSQAVTARMTIGAVIAAKTTRKGMFAYDRLQGTERSGGEGKSGRVG